MSETSASVVVAIVGLIGVLLGIATEKYIERRVDRAKDMQSKKDHMHAIDRAAYERLVANWHKLLDLYLDYPALQLRSDDEDAVLSRGSEAHHRRLTVYEFLFSTFEQYVSIRPALLDPDRLGPQTDSAESWDEWVKAHFRKPSVREHYLSWRGRDFHVNAANWLETIYLETERASTPSPNSPAA